MDKTNNKVEEMYNEFTKFAIYHRRNGERFVELADKDVKDFLRQALTSSYEQGQKDILKLANDLTEKPDRAVRYVPLDKLIEAWQSENN